MPPIIAALHTPRQSDGALDLAALRANLAHVLAQPISGVCVNGASGEYWISTPEEKELILREALDAARDRRTVVCGIGCATFDATVEFGRRALAAGADKLLLPPPTNSDYTADDIEDFCVEAAQRIGAPLWLYRLRAHRTCLTTENVSRMMARARGRIVGIKDSSGGLEILEALTLQQHNLNAVRILGDDSLMPEALRRELCDQIISGVAGVLPELMLSISESVHMSDAANTARRWAEISELIARLDQFPVSWGLKLIAELRGFADGAYFPLPLTRERSKQVRAFQAWYQVWSANALINPTRGAK